MTPVSRYRLIVAHIALVLPLPALSATIPVSTVAQLEVALDRARAVRSANPAEPISIELAEGTYSLTRAVVLDELLSGAAGAPLELRPQAGAKVTLSGGRELPPLDWQPQPSGIWRARLQGPAFALLWLDDRRLVRARYPNYDPSARPFGGVSADATSPARVARWANATGGVIHALHGGRWGGMHIAILGKAPDGTLKLAPPTGNNREKVANGGPSESARFVENIREELDAPGEWYFDAKDRWLYFKPLADGRPPRTGFVASHLQTLIKVGGQRAMAHDVRITGLQYRYTEPTYLLSTEPLLRSDWKFHRGGAVLIENAERVEVAEGDFAELGGNAVVISGHARAISVRANEIRNIGGTAIAFVGRPGAVRSPLFEYGERLALESIDRTPGPVSEDYPADSLAEDNLIHDIGEIEKQAAGVQIAMAARITVSHNSIYRVPRAGINIGDGTWGGHLVTGNDVFETVLETGDHGAFNSWGRDRFWYPNRGEMDRRVAAEPGLVRLDAIETVVIRHNRFRSEHGWDIDLDDGSSNYLIEDNLMLSGGLKFREGFDRIARNNILFNNSFHPHVWFAGSRDVFEHNIVMAPYQPIRIGEWGRSIDWNLFPSDSALANARANGIDAHSLAGSPQFVDPSKGDYSVAPTSPALRVGFRNFPMSFGVRPERLRSRAERPDFPAPIARAVNAVGEQPRDYLGMRIKSVETLGEQSAAGLSSMEGVMVVSIEPGGLAERGGLQSGDVIVEIVDDDYGQTSKITKAEDFIVTAHARRWRGAVDLTILRNQAKQRQRLPLQ
jgi:hypothetical protein